MTKQEIINKLNKNHKDFAKMIKGLNSRDFMFSPDNKWTAGQHLDHIFRSVSPLIMAFTLPKFIIRLLFGKANQPSISYDELINKYLSKLEKGGTATGKYVPKAVKSALKEQLANHLLEVAAGLTKKIDKYTEEQLDEYVLPHPLLGKITIREMLFFTIHHAEQHHNTVLRNTEQKLVYQHTALG